MYKKVIAVETQTVPRELDFPEIYLGQIYGNDVSSVLTYGQPLATALLGGIQSGSMMSFGLFNQNDPDVWRYLISQLPLTNQPDSLVAKGPAILGISNDIIPVNREADSVSFILIPDATKLAQSSFNAEIDSIRTMAKNDAYVLVRWPIMVDGLNGDQFYPNTDARMAALSSISTLNTTTAALSLVSFGSERPEPKAYSIGHPTNMGYEWVLYQIKKSENSTPQ